MRRIPHKTAVFRKSDCTLAPKTLSEEFNAIGGWLLWHDPLADGGRADCIERLMRLRGPLVTVMDYDPGYFDMQARAG